jgi:hypothetical protein
MNKIFRSFRYFYIANSGLRPQVFQARFLPEPFKLIYFGGPPKKCFGSVSQTLREDESD